MEKIDALVIGGGQAGIAMSEHLSAGKIRHLVLERARIAERWRSGRWDALVANGPAWHDRFPGMTFDEVDPSVRPDDFPTKDLVADYLEAYARKFSVPIRTGVEVREVRPIHGRGSFRVETSEGVLEAGSVVVATGAFQAPSIPGMVPADTGLVQIHSAGYRNPRQLPDGAVLVVGSGSSGVQIADELDRAGRTVFLCVGPHDRPPRQYRGRDFCWWLGVLGKWDLAAPHPGTEHVTIAVSGARGGETIDFRRLAARGITLLGRAESYRDGKLALAGDLRRNLDLGDANHKALLDEADSYLARTGITLPEDPVARAVVADSACITDPILSLDLKAAGITSIVWATGYGVDYTWIAADTFDGTGRPIHHRGVSRVPGLYFLGLSWQSRRGSSFIWGVWHDARHLADQIGIQRNYLAYHEATVRHPDPAP